MFTITALYNKHLCFSRVFVLKISLTQFSWRRVIWVNDLYSTLKHALKLGVHRLVSTMFPWVETRCTQRDGDRVKTAEAGYMQTRTVYIQDGKRIYPISIGVVTGKVALWLVPAVSDCYFKKLNKWSTNILNRVIFSYDVCLHTTMYNTSCLVQKG